MNVFGPAELMDDVINRGLCIGCGTRVNLCPYFCSHLRQTAQLFTCTLEQGRCHAACPKPEVDLAELARHNSQASYQGAPLGKFQRALAARAGSNLMRTARRRTAVYAVLRFAADGLTPETRRKLVLFKDER